MRTLKKKKKNASTFHGYAQSPLFKGVLGVWRARGRFTLLSQTRCETFVKRQKPEKGQESPENKGL